MQVPNGPLFIKFFKSLPVNKKQDYINCINSLFLEIGHTSININVGEYISGSISTELYLFDSMRNNKREKWSLVFLDTAIPHAYVTMWKGYGTYISSFQTLNVDYTTQFIEKSLADVVEGTAKPRYLIQRFVPYFQKPIIYGRQNWVYLMLKIDSIMPLHNRFNFEISNSIHTHIYDFSDFLYRRMDWSEIITIEHSLNSVKNLFDSYDGLFLEKVDTVEIDDWLEKIGVDITTWINAKPFSGSKLA